MRRRHLDETLNALIGDRDDLKSRNSRQSEILPQPVLIANRLRIEQLDREIGKRRAALTAL